MPASIEGGLLSPVGSIPCLPSCYLQMSAVIIPPSFVTLRRILMTRLIKLPSLELHLDKYRLAEANEIGSESIARLGQHVIIY